MNKTSIAALAGALTLAVGGTGIAMAQNHAHKTPMKSHAKPMQKSMKNTSKTTEATCGAHHQKAGEGKCAAANNNTNMTPTNANKTAEGKCGEGKCGATHKAPSKTTEGKCGEGKCGAK